MTKFNEELNKKIKELVLKSSNSEATLTKIRQKQLKFNNDLNMLENEKSKLDIDLKALNENITNLRIEVKSHEVNFENYSSTLKQSGVDLKNIDHEAYKEKDVIKLQNELETAQSKILRLGAINLAAPSEIEEENTRLSELDEQLEDLNTALEKLSSAIKQIDKETKIKFQESFDSVNNRLKQVFPDLFGGGVASLSLTEDNPLYAGVVLEAKPPGKKNSSISQLSGGEKALTALALVFGIFELNPAPFCLLDEVDAPLDDLNSSRFINMVEKMSKNVQFIFITHNKVSMERSNHLMGVTMQEPGVSRIVSVDVNQAVEMAEV